MSSIAIRITPTNTATSTDAKIDYLRYRPSSPTVYTSCETSSGSCSIVPVTLVDKKIRLSFLRASGNDIDPTSVIPQFIVFEAPNASGSTAIPQSKIRIQMGGDVTLQKDLIITP